MNNLIAEAGKWAQESALNLLEPFQWDRVLMLRRLRELPCLPPSRQGTGLKIRETQEYKDWMEKVRLAESKK